MTDLRQAAQAVIKAWDNDGSTQTMEDLRTALAQEHALHDLARLGQEIEQQAPFSPEAINTTQTAWKMGYEAAKAEQQAEPEQEQKYEKRIAPYSTTLSMLLNTAPPQQQAEPVCPECKAAVLYECVACSSNNYPTQQQAEPPPEWPLIKNILAEYGLGAISFVAEWKAAQRRWQGLREEDWEHIDNKKGTALDTFTQGAVWAAEQLKERNK